MSKLSTLRNKTPFQYLFRIRDWMMLKLGLFNFKKTIKHNLFYLRIIIEDWRKKRKIEQQIKLLPKNKVYQDLKDGDVVVSVTSYGKRVSNSLPYMLYSLLRQTVLPPKIVVYLDDDNWSNENLPWTLKCLQETGIDFRYCKDIRSYKKLIPALIDFDKHPIITVDDDLYYNEHLVEWLLDAYQLSDKRTVIGTIATKATIEGNMYLPYSRWDTNSTTDGELCLIGCGGILYPPSVFDAEILKDDLFMSLAPTADDLWFWAMEKRAGLRTTLTEIHGQELHMAVNRQNVYFPAKNPDNLYYINELMDNKNDVQLQKLIDQYNLQPT